MESTALRRATKARQTEFNNTPNEGQHSVRDCLPGSWTV